MDEPPSSKKIKLGNILWEEELDTFPVAENVEMLSHTTDGYQMSFQVSKQVQELCEESDIFTSVSLTGISKPEATYGFELLLQTVPIHITHSKIRLDRFLAMSNPTEM